MERGTVGRKAEAFFSPLPTEQRQKLTAVVSYCTRNGDDMKVPALVIYGDVSKKFDIPVGDGDKSFKWLGLVAAQRFTLRSPHGSLRLREQRPITGQNSQLIPNTMWTDESVFYHPAAMIKDHLSEGQLLNIELISKVPVDDLGVPQMARWAFIAFSVSEPKQDKRAKMLKDQLDEIEEARVNAEREELERRVREAQMKIFEMKEVMRPQLAAEEMNNSIMLEEWGHMSQGSVLDNIVPSFQEQTKIRNFFVKNYAQLSEMFKHAAAVGSDAGTGTISYMEFSNFLKESSAVHGTHHNDAMVKIFTEANIQDGSHDGHEGNPNNPLSRELHQHEFFVAIIATAVYLNITLKSKGGRSSVAAARGRRGSQKITPSTAVETLYDGAFRPYIEKHLEGTSIKAALGTDEVLLLFKENDEKLRHVFRIYGDRVADKNSKINLSNAMNLKEFGNCVSDSGLLKRSNTKSNDELTFKEIRQAFAAAQHDSAIEVDEKQAVEDGGRSNHLTQMTYCEFLEAIARLGAAKWEQGSLYDKICRAIMKIVGILDLDKPNN